MDGAGKLRCLPRQATTFRYRAMESLAPDEVVVSARFRLESADSDEVKARVDALWPELGL